MRPPKAGILLVGVAVALAGAAGAPGRARAGPADGLLQRAQTTRQAAEKDLADARKRRLAERKDLAAELQRAYADLAAAKAEATREQAAFDKLQAESADLERSTALASHRTDSLIAQAAGCSGAEVDPNATVEVMERAIWAGFAGRLAAIEAASKITVRPGKVVARNGAEAGTAVLALGGYAAYACGPARDTCGLLRALPEGKQLVAGPYLTGPQAAALRAAAAGHVEHLPIDVDGALIGRAPAEPGSIGTWLAAGGMFVYPILAAGALGLLLILERVVYLVRTKAPAAQVAEVLACLQRRDTAAARRAAGVPRTPTARVLLAGVEAAAKPDEEREAAMESALLAEAPKLERSLSLLGALAGVAPLLGLLGTVSGMIATFDTISVAGTGNPRLLSGGISEALITTELGLVMAIPLLLAHAWLSRWAERREAVLEYNAIQVFGVRHAAPAEDEER